MRGLSIRLQNVYKSYPDRYQGSGTIKIIKDLSFEIDAGEMLALVGPSGSGKSTLARLLANLECVDAGQIITTRPNPSPDGLAKQASGVQMLFQNPMRSLNPKWRVAAILEEALMSSQLREKQNDILGMLERFKLPDSILGQKPQEISGGEAQRIALIRVLLTRPDFLILDEPTSSLDILARVQFADQIKGLATEYGMTVLLITHDLRMALKLCSRIIVLDNGKLVDTINPLDPKEKWQSFTQDLFVSLPSFPDQYRRQVSE